MSASGSTGRSILPGVKDWRENGRESDERTRRPWCGHVHLASFLLWRACGDKGRRQVAVAAAMRTGFDCLTGDRRRNLCGPLLYALGRWLHLVHRHRFMGSSSGSAAMLSFLFETSAAAGVRPGHLLSCIARAEGGDTHTSLPAQQERQQ
jgi:hypothetical protein